MKNIIANKIIEVLKEPLSKKGFKLKNKTTFERVNNQNRQEQYAFSLSKNKGYFKLHLVLKVLDKKYLKQYNEVLKKH